MENIKRLLTQYKAHLEAFDIDDDVAEMRNLLYTRTFIAEKIDVLSESQLVTLSKLERKFSKIVKQLMEVYPEFTENIKKGSDIFYFYLVGLKIAV